MGSCRAGGQLRVDQGRLRGDEIKYEKMHARHSSGVSARVSFSRSAKIVSQPMNRQMEEVGAQPWNRRPYLTLETFLARNDE